MHSIQILMRNFDCYRKDKLKQLFESDFNTDKLQPEAIVPRRVPRKINELFERFLLPC